MWVKEQWGRGSVEVHNYFAVAEIEKDKETGVSKEIGWYIYTLLAEDTQTILGRYANEEKAKEVISRMDEAISFNVRQFKMPLNDEVK